MKQIVYSEAKLFQSNLFLDDEKMFINWHSYYEFLSKIKRIRLKKQGCRKV